MSHSLFTSESVAIGHPDKVADQISDTILDACLAEDPESRVACETLVSSGLVVLAGEITSTAKLDYSKLVRNTIREIGYDEGELGFDYRSCGIITTINQQSLDIALGVNAHANGYKEQGAGDQGLVFGYACDETAELMPMPIMLAHALVRKLRNLRVSKEVPYLKPDGKSQVTIEYDAHHNPIRLQTVVISAQHTPEITQERVHADMQQMIRDVVPKHFIDAKTLFYINPTGRFVTGGPMGDCGLTGRKIIVDTYGGMGRHGGGCFSGKDPSKLDRSGCYAARYVAKNIVAAKIAPRCEIQISYAIGIPYPVSIKVDTFGNSTVSEEILCQAIPKVFDLSPRGIAEMLNLKRPIYRQTAFGGHFGRDEPDFTWEKTDRVEALLEAIPKGKQSKNIGNKN